MKFPFWKGFKEHIMGCGLARHVEGSIRPIFHVSNVDEEGRFIKSCHIQVTHTDLVLYQRGESPILWPLLSLRRYGFDSDLFSFECGKHCATGPGIYAFKCRKAESLFSALQESLQAFSESELGVSSLTNQESNGSALLGEADLGENGNADTQKICAADASQHATFEYDKDTQPSTSTGIKKPIVYKPGIVIPTAPERSVSDVSVPSTVSQSEVDKEFERLALAPRLLPDPYKKLFDKTKQMFPRCCTIGTCISASNQHYMTRKAFQKTTCGSCRTCSLNMCVVQPNVNSGFNTFDSEERARQADYGNVLDPRGKPRQCVHCCCDFKPSTHMSSCSADNCPLHFNNCVDQITNYIRLEKHMKRNQSLDIRLKKRRMAIYQPFRFPSHAHLYTNIPTPTKKWPISEQSKGASWRSLPHLQVMSTGMKVAPKRSASHFCPYPENLLFDKSQKSQHRKTSQQSTSYVSKGADMVQTPHYTSNPSSSPCSTTKSDLEAMNEDLYKTNSEISFEKPIPGSPISSSS